MASDRLTRSVALLLGVLLVSGALTVQAGTTAQVGAGAKQGELETVRSDVQPGAANVPASVSYYPSVQLLAKAQPDECFRGSIGAGPYATPTNGDCGELTPKKNQAYVWGVTKPNADIWFGTVANTLCLALGGVAGPDSPLGSVGLEMQTNSWVCEFGAASYLQAFNGDDNPLTEPPLSPEFGDWRPPRIFVYHTASGQLVEKTESLDAEGLLRLNQTMGLRAAGTIGDLVILGGPSRTSGIIMPQAINLFAFRASDGAYLGSTTLPGYTDIRKWVVAGGQLYAAVGRAVGADQYGSVLRWQGTVADPFAYEVVGLLDNDAAEIVEHDGRLYVATWPTVAALGPSREAGLWMSPPLGEVGPHTAGQWQKVWQASDYEPDPLVAKTYFGGALASFDGYLYWGTLHAPLFAAITHLMAHEDQYAPAPSEADVLAAILGTHRAISIFRVNTFDQGDEPEVLYGETVLPVYLGGDLWLPMPTKMGSPKYGESGFGNYFNTYTWSMAVYDQHLYVGTFDWSYIAPEAIRAIVTALTGVPPTTLPQLPAAEFGADLFRFPSSTEAAVPVSIDGLGNLTNYGIRNMLSDDALYLGMANAMNIDPRGGWELLELTHTGEGKQHIYVPLVIRAP